MARERRTSKSVLAALPRARIAFTPPMLATATGKVPEGPQWVYEIKLDGYRGLAIKRDGRVDIFSRRGNRLKYPTLIAAFDALADDTIVDGEVVAVDASGRPSFNDLQNWMPSKPIYFYAFDLIAYRGRDTTKLPLSERRSLLEDALKPLRDPIRLSPIIETSADDLIRAVRENSLEGIVAKRLDGTYDARARSDSWLKFKIGKSDEFVVGGYVRGTYVFDSLCIGRYDDAGKLIFVGKVRNGFTPRLRMRTASKFRGLETDKCPFANLPEVSSGRWGVGLTVEGMKDCAWLKPKLVVEVGYSEFARHLRHPRFIRMREDKAAREAKPLKSGVPGRHLHVAP
ncbi:MAG TPA: RNA ligase family protein [Candidatus Acidoferrales bacterium]|nr:RNA ligase family protein [Candidatus Acidoferrales bacterium]